MKRRERPQGVSVKSMICNVRVSDSYYNSQIFLQLLSDGWYRVQIWAGYDGYDQIDFTTLEDAHGQFLEWINSEISLETMKGLRRQE